ncbi:MAG: hypothetical protein EBU67_03090 [Actinobacteria bacterium]|jgi:hypothetical protein|nr:hypothetical protein [Actinomycetota bacterium]NBP53275.1 hypothetical protein [Actinomycetota bacterium]
MNVYERRRIAVLAIATTVIAFAFVATNGSSDSATDTTTGVTTTIESTSTSTPLENASAVGPLADDSSKPVNLDGPLAQQPTGTAPIAYPGPGEMNRVNAKASYVRFPDYNSAICYASTAPLGVEVTIVNLNNGRSLTCTNVFAVTLPAGADVVIHTPLYLQIANLVDAPLPVTVSW